jgi:pilus retraction protein PilT
MRLDEVLVEATQSGATDVFLAAGAVPCLQVDGVYMPLKLSRGHRLPNDLAIRLAREAMNERQWTEFEKTMEANLAYMTDTAGRYRLNVFFQRGTVAMVCRRVVTDIPTMRQLGLPPVLRQVALADRGIVLVTGSTGSGKSTTLASLIDYRNHLRTGHIVTIEDPVEFVYRHHRSIVTQREVGIDTLSFHEALKNTLRQAPQVICIGELRDAETVQFAMHASETGHLVFATLHSTNASLALERILHFYPGELKEQLLIQLALNLKAILSQRLIPRARGGRVAAVEILINTPRIQDLITKGEMGGLRMALAAENSDGNLSFDKSIYRLHRRGLITMEDALQAAESANDLQIKFRGIGITPGSSWEDLADPWARIASDYEPPDPTGPQKTTGGSYTNEGAPMMRPAPSAPAAPGPPQAKPPQAPAPGPAPQQAAPPRPAPPAQHAGAAASARPSQLPPAGPAPASPPPTAPRPSPFPPPSVKPPGSEI